MRDLTTGVRTRMKAKSGTAPHVLVEMEFDSPVGNVSPGQSTYITWVARNSSEYSDIVVLARLDGNPWEECYNGGPIPGIENDQSYAGRTIHVRQLFRMDGTTRQSPELISLKLQIYFDEGETLWEHEENGYTALRNATLRGVEVVNDVQPLVRLQNQTGAVFGNAGGYAYFPETGVLHVSRPTEDAAVAESLASFSVEGWVWVDPQIFVGGGLYATVWSWDEGPELQISRDFLSFRVLLVRNGSYGSRWAQRIDSLAVESARNIVQGERWYHIAFTWNGTRATLFIDGALAGSVTARTYKHLDAGGDPEQFEHPTQHPYRGPWALQTDGPFRLGQIYAHNDAGVFDDPEVVFPSPFRGRMDEVRVWKQRVLNSADVVRRMTRSLTLEERVRYGNGGDFTLALDLPCDGSFTDRSGFDNPVEVRQPEGFPEDIHFETFAEPWSVFGNPQYSTAVGYRESPPVTIRVQGERCLRVASTSFPVAWSGKSFLGAAHIGSVGAVKESASGELTGMSFTLTAIPEGKGLANIAIALGEQYCNRPARMWLALLNELNLIEPDPVIIYEGLMDTMPFIYGKESALSVNTEHWLRDWLRASMRRWTHNDQQRRYPWDLFFSLLQRVLEKEIWWPGTNELKA